MFNSIKKIVLFMVLSTFISFAFAEEQEQLKTERYADGGVHYGLPGWEREMGPFMQGLPDSASKSFVHLDLCDPLYPLNKMKFGGKEYCEVSVTSTGRIYLGHLPDGYEIQEGVNGAFPYIEATKMEMQIPQDEDFIPVRSRRFNPKTGYGVVQIGPFNIEGLKHKLEYQVYFYLDGEIQFQAWIHWDEPKVYYDEIAAFAYCGQYSQSPLYEIKSTEYLNPTLYTGGRLLSSDYGIMIAPKNELIVSNGKLRPGWIAKSFDKKHVSFTEETDAIRIDFGTDTAAGGLFAYDYSREHPIVGSFTYVSIDVESINYGEGRKANSAIPVWFWYFEEFYPNQSDSANYPFFRDGQKLGQKEDVLNRWKELVPDEKKFSAYNNFITIWPIAYMKSWNKAKYINEIDATKAIAFKFQTSEMARNRAIRIKNVSYGLREPRSVQFLPPKTHKLTFEAEGGRGYMRGINFSDPLPYEFVDGAIVDAEIVSLPGNTIEKIEVNGIALFKDGTPVFDGFIASSGENRKKITLPDWWNVDAHVKVTYKKCDNRLLSEVEPSYVKTEIFIDPSDASRKIESYAVKDGLGRVVQTQTPLANGFYSISATYLDDFGNVEYAPMSYLSQKNAFAYEDMFCEQCVIKSSIYHDGTDDLERQNAYGFPYAEQDYHYGEDNGVTNEIAGVAEASFANWNVTAKQWTIPLKTSDTSNFLPEEQLEEKYLTEKYTVTKRNIVDENADVESWMEYSYKLVVNRSAEGLFTQQIFDANGNILYAWAKSGNGTVVSRTHYNADNQVDTVDIAVNGGAFGLPTIYTYDVAGRIKTVSSPDKGTVESVYGPDDNLRFTRDARQLALAQSLSLGGNYFSTIEYDALGRVTKTGEVRGGHSFADSATPVPDNKLYILSENFYGKPTKGELLSTGVTTDDALLQGILDEMEGVFPNDVGAVASYDGSRTRSDAALRANTLKMSSYNRLGQKVRQWTIHGMTGTPATRISYSYNVSGELASSESAEWKNGSWNTISTLTYFYDKLGRLESVHEDGDSLMRVDRAPGGTISKKAYFDKGVHVYDMTYAKDIYGRTTHVEYKDASDKVLYSETATYPSVVAGRLATAVHAWDGYGSTETYTYDAQNRLASFTSDNSQIGYGYYQYDALGRITFKSEGGSSVAFRYNNNSFRPNAMNINGADTTYYSYDASGNVWLDRRTKSAYTLNVFGVPDKIRLFTIDPDYVTLDQVNSTATLTNEIANTTILYDETGSRVWRRTIRPKDDLEELTVPGVGEYHAQHYRANGDFELNRIDLVGGGYRDVANDMALFPVKDLQGSVRGYADKNGLRSAIGYRPYGTSENLMIALGNDNMRRWQSKEYDAFYGKYDFGARYYDPFFGLWMSPDPAGQFANPYTYGGDPLNDIDPTGMWAGGVGVVVSWDKQHGWGFGVGESVQIGRYGINRSYMFHQDGSNTLDLGFDAKIPIQTPYVYIEINMGLGFSMNSYSGAVFSTHGGACVGEAGNCVGEDQGGSVYFDRGGGFGGVTVYYEVYMQAAGGLERVSTGYEAGLFGAEGRGFYAGGTLAGVHAEVSERDGSSWGMQESVYFKLQDDGPDPKTDKPRKYVGLSIPTLGVFSEVVKYDHGNRNDNQKDIEGLNRGKFNALAESKGLETGHYSPGASGLHENNKLVYYLRLIGSKLTFSLIDPPRRTVDKMWMGRNSSFSFLYGWFLIPSVEGLFYPGGEYVKGASYNYGNFFITHILWDIIPSLVFDHENKNKQ